MNAAKKMLIVLLICLNLCGCSEIRECKVVDKQYQPAHTVLTPVYNGKNIMLLPTYYPEQYFIVIEGIDDDGKAHRRSVQVSPVDYENVVIGQEWESVP